MLRKVKRNTFERQVVNDKHQEVLVPRNTARGLGGG
jgi:hypothetical protein